MYFTVARQPNASESIISNPFGQEDQFSRLSHLGDTNIARSLKHRKRKEILKHRTYSVLGFLETLGLLETVIRKLLQNLLHPIVTIEF